VLPLISFSSFVRFNDHTRRLPISGAPAAIEDYPAFSKFLAGGRFSSDDAQEVIVTEDCLRQFSAEWARERRTRRNNAGRITRPSAPPKTEEERAREASEVIGKEITLLTLRTANAAPSSVFGIPLLMPSAPAAGQAADASNDERFERHAFRIVGVLPSERGPGGPNINFMMPNSQMIVPIEQARRFREANRDPMSQMSQAITGEMSYPSAEVRVMDPTHVESVEAQLKQLGLRAFSITNQIDSIKRVFLIVNSSLALIGGLALLVASFGISNTMIMSIRERTREIGIMKAIGGSDGEIMRIFFVEASLIGFSGGVLGVLGGWVVDLIANALANRWIVQQATYIEFFSIPWYLWSGAIAFAILISLLAAIYPALHAAKVDPIKALRHE
jgi:ABC-type antimicrobial peptide transport system permease subunit